MEFIGGEDRSQTSLFPESIEDYVGNDNAVRVIDAYIDSLDLAGLEFGKPEPNDAGRPMYDPRDMLKPYVYGYMNRIRSSRRLETESRSSIEAIWLPGRLPPDHKAIARFRGDNPAALKNAFRDFAKLRMGAGPVRQGADSHRRQQVQGREFQGRESHRQEAAGSDRPHRRRDRGVPGRA